MLAGAAADHERLRFAYRAGDGTASRRLVEPYRLVAAGRRWYLVAFDNDRDDWRIFRVDRIERAPPDRSAGPAAESLRPRTPQPSSPPGCTRRRPPTGAVATLHASAEWVAARLGDAAGELEPIDADTCRLCGQSDTLEWLAFRLVTLGCEFEVHEPPELVEHLREMAARTLRAV